MNIYKRFHLLSSLILKTLFKITSNSYLFTGFGRNVFIPNFEPLM